MPLKSIQNQDNFQFFIRTIWANNTDVDGHFVIWQSWWKIQRKPETVYAPLTDYFKFTINIRKSSGTFFKKSTVYTIYIYLYFYISFIREFIDHLELQKDALNQYTINIIQIYKLQYNRWKQ